MGQLEVMYPMGALSAKTEKLDTLWDNHNWVCERKYDGSRYLCRIENDEVRFVSRQKSRQTGLPVDKTENVPHLVEIFSDFPNGTIFDGEIITHENGNSNEVTSIMGSKPERAIQLQKERGWLKYVVFDVLYYDGTDFRNQPYKVRRKAVEQLIDGFLINNFSHSERGNGSDYVFPAPIIKDNKKAFYKKVVEEGGEGVMLKNIHKPYIVGKKPTDTWLKVKKYATYDVVILGYTEPTKEYTGNYPDDWQYWETAAGKIHHTKESALQCEYSMAPITKDYYMGWIGAVIFGQWIPQDQYEERVKEKKLKPSNIMEEINGVPHYLVEIGQTDGLSDEWKEKFTENQQFYLGKVMEVGGMEQLPDTYAIRHPRFIRIREDKQSNECIAGEY